MKRSARVGGRSELGTLLKSLARRSGVSVRYGEFLADVAPEDLSHQLAGQIHALVAEVHPLWERHASGDTLPTPAEIAAALRPLADGPAAVELLTSLAADSLVLPGSHLMDRAAAQATATRLVTTLGPAATWWTNRTGRAWTSVSACTFDGVIAGTDGARFALLLQLAED